MKRKFKKSVCIIKKQIYTDKEAVDFQQRLLINEQSIPNRYKGTAGGPSAYRSLFIAAMLRT